MRKLKTNPFEIFGLTPQLIKEMDDETLFKVIKTIYRTLQMLYHPDRGGDPRKSLELNLAFEAINYEKNPQGFQHYKKAYLQRLSRKTLRKELEDLKEGYRKLTYLYELLKERFWLYLESDHHYLKSLYREGFVLKVKLLDVISQINFGSMVSFKKQKKFFTELVLGPEIILKKAGGREKYQILKQYKFLGAIKREHFAPWAIMERDLREEKFYLKNYFSKETFIREALIYLYPEIKPNYYLFFYNYNEPHRVYLEGLALKLEEITHLEFLEILKKESVEASDDS